MTKLFVGNLPSEVTPADLRLAFAAFGAVSTIDIVSDTNGESRGFGFVEMASPVEAAAAIKGLDGTALKGRAVNVSRARPRSGAGRDASRGWAVVGDGRNRW